MNTTNHQTRPRGYGDAAGLYLAAGWAGVLPLPPRAKKRPPKVWLSPTEAVSFTGYDGVDPTAAQVRAWMRTRPGGNVALRMPATVVGLDLDLYKAVGAASYARLVDELGPLPATWRSSARTDGSGIALFTMPAGVRWAERRAGDGIELIHHGHRYAVVWPSLNPDTATIYRWWTPTLIVAGWVPRVDEVPALPAAWGRRLTESPASKTATVITHPGRRRRVAGSGYAAAALAGAVDELAAMGAGSGRNNTLNRKAYALGGLVAAGHLDHATVARHLYDAAVANGHVAKHGERQTMATIDSGLRAGAARPRRSA